MNNSLEYIHSELSANELFQKLNVLGKKKTHYQELKQGLMQQLLTGKLRVPQFKKLG